jgi:hypothetical protein
VMKSHIASSPYPHDFSYLPLRWKITFNSVLRLREVLIFHTLFHYLPLHTKKCINVKNQKLLLNTTFLFRLEIHRYLLYCKTINSTTTTDLSTRKQMQHQQQKYYARRSQ